MNTINFSYPVFLIIGVIVVLIGLFFYSTRKKIVNFSEDKLLQKVFKSSSIWYKVYLGTIISITISIFIYMAGPYSENSYETIKKNGIDIEIVMDLSYSMIAEDIVPSRLEVAKTVFIDFIQGLASDRVGLILFSGKPFQSVPLTYDYNFLGDFVGEISIETINQRNPQLQGTAIGDALILASDILVRDENDREKVIILITDGEANRGVEPLLALKLLKEEEIKTYTIGVGKDEATLIRAEVAPGIYQNIEIGGIDEQILEKISSETGGEYFRADSESALREILDRISDLEKKEVELEVLSSSHSHRKYISILLGLLTLVLILCTSVIHIRHA